VVEGVRVIVSLEPAFAVAAVVVGRAALSNCRGSIRSTIAPDWGGRVLQFRLENDRTDWPA